MPLDQTKFPLPKNNGSIGQEASVAITVDQLKEKLNLIQYNLDDGTREVTGGYAGDLLSWVMGRATSG
ncbi:MAG: hypothetical protein IK064_03960, partial [Clostridia bacterium]|nr:hypothetical protein [Clostridia bacterium]